MSRQRRITIASLVLVLAVTGGACGSKSDKATNASSKKEAAAADASKADAGIGTDPAATDAAAKAATDGKKPAAKGSKSAAASATTSTSIDVKQAAKDAGLDISKFEGDWVAGSPKGQSADNPVPAGCDFSPGQICRFQITGNYGLKTQDVATIEVGAYDDGEKKPSFFTKLPGAKKGSSPWYVKEFPYTARQGVKEMAIIVRLLAADGKELARGNPTVYPIAQLRGN